MTNTVIGVFLNDELVAKYFKNLVNCFFKILPIRESGEPTLPIYIHSLQMEILGCKALISGLDNNPYILTLISILQYLHDNPDTPVADVKREVFRAITICKKLESQYKKVVEP